MHSPENMKELWKPRWLPTTDKKKKKKKNLYRWFVWIFVASSQIHLELVPNIIGHLPTTPFSFWLPLQSSLFTLNVFVIAIYRQEFSLCLYCTYMIFPKGGMWLNCLQGELTEKSSILLYACISGACIHRVVEIADHAIILTLLC